MMIKGFVGPIPVLSVSGLPAFPPSGVPAWAVAEVAK
jgi:hypothetical protein